MKARIVKERRGILDYYIPQIKRKYFFGMVSGWSNFWVSVYSGKIHYYKSVYQTYSGAMSEIKNYEKLTGIKLEIVEE